MSEPISKNPYVLIQKGEKFEAEQANWKHRFIKYIPGLSRLLGIKVYLHKDIPTLANSVFQNPGSEKARSLTQSLRVMSGVQKETSIFNKVVGAPSPGNFKPQLFRGELLEQLLLLKKGANEDYSVLKAMISENPRLAEEFFSVHNPESITLLLANPQKALEIVKELPEVHARVECLAKFASALKSLDTNKNDIDILTIENDSSPEIFKDVERMVLTDPELVRKLVSPQDKVLFVKYCPFLNAISKLDLTTDTIKPEELHRLKNVLESSELKTSPDTKFWIESLYLNKLLVSGQGDLYSDYVLNNYKVDPISHHSVAPYVPFVIEHFAKNPNDLLKYSGLRLTEQSFSDPKREVAEFKKELNRLQNDTTQTALYNWCIHRLSTKLTEFVNDTTKTLLERKTALDLVRPLIGNIIIYNTVLKLDKLVDPELNPYNQKLEKSARNTSTLDELIEYVKLNPSESVTKATNIVKEYYEKLTTSEITVENLVAFRQSGSAVKLRTNLIDVLCTDKKITSNDHRDWTGVIKNLCQIFYDSKIDCPQLDDFKKELTTVCNFIVSKSEEVKRENPQAQVLPDKTAFYKATTFVAYFTDPEAFAAWQDEVRLLEEKMKAKS